jgi:hypothetical protein
VGSSLLHATHSSSCQSKYLTLSFWKASSWSRNYQDSVTVCSTSDDNAVGKDDEHEQDEVSLELNSSGSILSTVEKASASNHICIG